MIPTCCSIYEVRKVFALLSCFTIFISTVILMGIKVHLSSTNWLKQKWTKGFQLVWELSVTTKSFSVSESNMPFKISNSLDCQFFLSFFFFFSVFLGMPVFPFQHLPFPEGNTVGLLLFGNSSPPYINSCAGHHGVYLCAWWLCERVYSTRKHWRPPTSHV